MNVVRERLANQLLTGAGAATGSDVVRTLGAVQAQDYAGAKWALSLRAGGASEARLEQEIDAGRILRTHVLRPTWHFVAPEDIRWMLALTAPRIMAAMASYNRKLELTPAIFRRSRLAIEKALAGGKHLTRAELRAVLEKARVGPAATQRLAHLMMQAELDAVVCSGPRRGKQSTYALLDERAPATAPLERDEALRELARRYFATRGPATAHDYSWWSGLTMRDVARSLELLGRELEQISINDKTLHFVPRQTPAPREIRTAHLLPNYDEYFIGFKDRSSIGRRIRDLKLVTGGDALIAHVVFIDGQLVGGWKRLVSGVDLRLVVPLEGAERKRLDGCIRRFSDWSSR